MAFSPFFCGSFGCFITRSIPYRLGGTCFLSDDLFSTCQEVVAFTGTVYFSTLFFSPGALLSVLYCISPWLTGPLGWTSLSVVFDEISIMDGGLSSSNSMATSGVFASPRFVTFPFLGAGCSGSLELEVSLIWARRPTFLSTFDCLWSLGVFGEYRYGMVFLS